MMMTSFDLLVLIGSTALALVKQSCQPIRSGVNLPTLGIHVRGLQRDAQGLGVSIYNMRGVPIVFTYIFPLYCIIKSIQELYYILRMCFKVSRYRNL